MRVNAVRGALLMAFALAAGVAFAEPEEIFSNHVQVFQPRGPFVTRLIRLVPPSGKGWKLAEDAKDGFRITLPADAEADTTASGSRILSVKLGKSAAAPQPVFRIDAFTPGKGDPADVDAEYAQRYAEQYPTAAFNNKFEVTDNGLVVLKKKTDLALVGGIHPVGQAQAYRLQLAYLSKERQLFLTFDCPADEWSRYQDTVGRMLLSFEPLRSKRKQP